MRLALSGLYRARWSAAIHEEWMRNVLAQRPDLTYEKLEQVRQLMDAHAPDCLVTGHEGLIRDLQLPDPDDRHVLAAAIRAGASVIVTYNLRDFPQTTLSFYGVEAQHPDEFVCRLFDADEYRVLAAVREQRAALRNPPVVASDFVAGLEEVRLPRTARRLRHAIHLI
jgi:predicted nucleic acid-binding protein